jgi:hypothetical protein
MSFLKNQIKNIYNLLLCLFNLFYRDYYNGRDPIFILSANRSGSSLLSNILRQHPDLYSLDSKLRNVNYKKINNHNSGFSEDFIWNSLNNMNSDHFNLKGEGYLWAHPKYLRDFYSEKSIFKSFLKKEIYKKNVKNKTPVIKNAFFTLKIKLIKTIFPNSKIIYNIRSYKDWIYSGYHKWSKDYGFKNSFKNNKPDLGLHWLILNTIAIYQLEKYFPNKYKIFYHECLYDNKINNNKLMNRLLKFLKLKKFNFNFELVDKKFKYSKKITYNYEKFDLIKNLVKFEKKII